jgi:murein DD-endopeptidase MepM/ murein hydrolase activator NlpD
MALRQMGEPVDLRRAIPDLKGRLGPQAYDDALRQRLMAVAGIGTQENEYSSNRAAAAQSRAFAKRLQDINSRIGAVSPGVIDPKDTGYRASNGSGGQPVKLPNGRWIVPTNGKVIFPFGGKYSAANQKVTGSATHRGIDFGGAAGTPIYSPFAGTLLNATGGGGWNSGRGNYIGAQFDGGAALLEHLQGFAPGLKAGMTITPGMLLGYMGSTGNANGVNHLHFETRRNINDPSSAFDPSSWFGW